MASSTVVEQLLNLPNQAERKQFLASCLAVLSGEQLAADLKTQADQLLRGDARRSLEIAELLYALAELTGNRLHRALGLLVEANACSIGGLGQDRRAIELCDEAAAIYGEYDLRVEQADTQVTKIDALAHLGAFDEALAAGRRAAEVFEAHAAWLKLANLTMNMGVVYGRMGQDATALGRFDRAKALYGRAGSEGEWYLAGVEQNRAFVLYNLGRFEESIQACEDATALLLQLGQTAEVGHVQQTQAFIYFVLGRYNETLELLYQARDTFLAYDRRVDVLEVELYITECLLRLRRFAEVLDRCAQIRDSFVQLGREFEAGYAALNQAVGFAGLQRYEEALASLVAARSLFTAGDNQVWAANADLEAAGILQRQGRFEESLALAQKCAVLFETHKLTVKQADAELVAAQALLALRRYDDARRFARRALAVAEAKSVPALSYQCTYVLASLAEAGGDLAHALTAYDRAIQDLEHLRGRLMVEFRPDFVQDKQAVYEDAVGLCLTLGQPAHGLEYAERAKSRALLDLLAYRLDLSVQARDAADRPLVEELMRLRSERDRFYRRWESDTDFTMRGGGPDDAIQDVDAPHHQANRHDVLALEKRITELWHTLLIRNADYARDAARWQVRTEPIQPYLQPDTVLLEYFKVRGQFVVFWVTADSVEAQRLSFDHDQVERLVEVLWLNLKMAGGNKPHQLTGLSTQIRRVLHQLYWLLVAPVEEKLSKFSRVIVVPHGPLHYVPFHALHDGERYWLERHTISYMPGASFLRYCSEMRPRATTARFNCCAFGHSYTGRLPYAVQEARAIAALTGGEEFLEEHATCVRLREVAGDCRILHLATHGDFRPDNPLFSGLALADGRHTTLDIFNLRLQASLVTLSACQTGRSVIGGGDELLGLMRAFLSAGAASLVLSLWPVDDRSTAELMQTFYGKLLAGWSKGAALQYAQQQYIEDSDNHAHPYFWAPFFLVGDTGPL